ncbi:hypothetical protein D9613_008739 [Agrocybe pediades]|uniref:DUF6533 domain-containing protein n=1 Tax=Agrocybe pediades TaxID=84607 RepID=A0A8H4QSI0_9AGAR|nr:hypothetical protein D9613_008739 [Agrocybe pediades]
MASAEHTRFLQYCIQYTSIALIFYDYSLTWTREVKYFWTKKFTFSTALYIACRYSMVSNILYLIALAGKLPKSLRSVNVVNGYQICCALSVLGRAAVVCVLGARTYAIYNMNKYILVVLGSLGATIIIMDSIHVRWVVCVGAPGPGDKISEPFGFSVAFALLVVVYEVLASMLTLYRGWQALCIRVDLKDGRNKLEYLVVKEGVLYFSFVSMFTLSALVMLNVAQNGSFIQRLLNALTLPISGMMTARFLLHLREWQHKAAYMSEVGPDEPLEFRQPTAESDTGNTNVYGSVVDEFGTCPIREARRYRKNIPYEDV